MKTVTLTVKSTSSFIFQQRDRYFASVHETGTDKPVCGSPRHLSHAMSVDGITSTTRVASCSTTPLSRRQDPRKCRSSVNLVSGRLSTDPATRSCLARDRFTSKEMKTKRQADVVILQRSLLILCNSRRAHQRGGTTSCME